MPAKNFTIETPGQEIQLFILMGLSTSQWEPAYARNIIRDFGTVVDCIEHGEFGPAPFNVLKAPFGKNNAIFGTAVCRNCDAGFSCDSYRQFALGSRARKEAAFKQYLDDYGTELEQQEWLSSEL